MFDNFLMTDDVSLAKDECDKIMKETVAGEKKMKDAKEEEERKAAEAEAETEDDDEEEDEDEDEIVCRKCFFSISQPNTNRLQT